MKNLTLMMILLTHLSLCSSAFLCDRRRTPTFYWLEGPEDCSEDRGVPHVLNITTLHTSPYRVKGWVITLSELRCTTHFFFWGSYSSTHSLKPIVASLPDSSQPGCPEGFKQFVSESDLLDNCKWTWPKKTLTVTPVCRVDVGVLENSPSGYYIDGTRAQCKNYMCTTDTGSVFIHTTSLDVLDSQTAHTDIVLDALCTPKYCIRPSTMTLYKMARTAPPLEGWDHSWVSTTGEIIHMKKPSTRAKRDTGEDIKKIMYLEEESLRLSQQTKMLCHIIKQLRTLFWLTSGQEPTILARDILGRPNIVAEVRENLLLVWGCNTVDSWNPRPTKICYEHLPITYKVKESPDCEQEGYLDTTTYEILQTSSSSPCRVFYLGSSSGGLISVNNGSTTPVNGSFPRPLVTLIRKCLLQSPFLGERYHGGIKSSGGASDLFRHGLLCP